MTDYNLENLNVLLVDDNKYMQRLLKEILRSFRIKNIRSADDGADAIKEMRTFAVDLVIADWNMQPIDGLEFVRMVRTSADSAKPFVPVIMLMGYTETHRVLAARDCGVSEFLAKPVSAKGLYQRIQTIIERPRKFIKTRTYTGPDRRRSTANDASNKGRRVTDSLPPDDTDPSDET